MQTAKGVFFTKWSVNRTVSRQLETEDFELYGATLKRASLVSSAGFSTVAMDSIAVGTPPLSFGMSADPKTLRLLTDFYSKGARVVPALKHLDFISDQSHFESELDRLLCGPKTDIKAEPSYGSYLEQVKPTDGTSGDIAAKAIADFLNESGAKTLDAIVDLLHRKLTLIWLTSIPNKSESSCINLTVRR